MADKFKAGDKVRLDTYSRKEGTIAAGPLKIEMQPYECYVVEFPEETELEERIQVIWRHRLEPVQKWETISVPLEWIRFRRERDTKGVFSVWTEVVELQVKVR